MFMKKIRDCEWILEQNELSELVARWGEFNGKKEDIAYVGLAFDKAEFTSLIKDTATAVRDFRKALFDFDKHTEYIKRRIWSYFYLLAAIEKCCEPLISDDESDDLILSAAQAIVRLLRGYALCPIKTEPTDISGVLVGTCEDCEVFCADVAEQNSEFWTQTFEYDPSKGDMSKFLELVKREKESAPF